VGKIHRFSQIKFESKSASEMTYIVSGGPLNSTQSESKTYRRTQEITVEGSRGGEGQARESGRGRKSPTGVQGQSPGWGFGDEVLAGKLSSTVCGKNAPPRPHCLLGLICSVLFAHLFPPPFFR